MDDFAKRVVLDAKEQSDKAITLGKRVHSFVERAIVDPIHAEEADPAQSEAEKKIRAAILEKVVPLCRDGASEMIVTGPGYAGRIDHINKHYITDFKTQGTKESKVVYYPEWLWQLAAYRDTQPQERLVPRSIVISTAEPGFIDIKEYSDTDTQYALKTFLAARDLFYCVKKLERTW